MRRLATTARAWNIGAVEATFRACPAEANATARPCVAFSSRAIDTWTSSPFALLEKHEGACPEIG